LEYHPGRRPSAQEIIEILKQTERKEPCIETGASSSTAPRASSHVEEDKIKITEEDKIKILEDLMVRLGFERRTPTAGDQ
jgi:hypothetical protein